MEIKKQELKQILTEQRKEYEHFIGVLKEDFDSKVELIGEQYFDIKKTLELHTKILESHTKILESHTEILESHTEMIASTKEDIEIMKVDIAFIKGELQQKVDIEQFSALERRVALLESKSR